MASRRRANLADVRPPQGEPRIPEAGRGVRVPNVRPETLRYSPTRELVDIALWSRALGTLAFAASSAYTQSVQDSESAAFDATYWERAEKSSVELAQGPGSPRPSVNAAMVRPGEPSLLKVEKAPPLTGKMAETAKHIAAAQEAGKILTIENPLLTPLIGRSLGTQAVATAGRMLYQYLPATSHVVIGESVANWRPGMTADDAIGEVYTKMAKTFPGLRTDRHAMAAFTDGLNRVANVFKQQSEEQLNDNLKGELNRVGYQPYRAQALDFIDPKYAAATPAQKEQILAAASTELQHTVEAYTAAGLTVSPVDIVTQWTGNLINELRSDPNLRMNPAELESRLTELDEMTRKIRPPRSRAAMVDLPEYYGRPGAPGPGMVLATEIANLASISGTSTGVPGGGRWRSKQRGMFNVYLKVHAETEGDAHQKDTAARNAFLAEAGNRADGLSLDMENRAEFMLEAGESLTAFTMRKRAAAGREAELRILDLARTDPDAATDLLTTQASVLSMEDYENLAVNIDRAKNALRHKGPGSRYAQALSEIKNDIGVLRDQYGPDKLLAIDRQFDESLRTLDQSFNLVVQEARTAQENEFTAQSKFMDGPGRQQLDAMRAIISNAAAERRKFDDDIFARERDHRPMSEQEEREAIAKFGSAAHGPLQALRKATSANTMRSHFSGALAEWQSDLDVFLQDSIAQAADPTQPGQPENLRAVMQPRLQRLYIQETAKALSAPGVSNESLAKAKPDAIARIQAQVKEEIATRKLQIKFNSDVAVGETQTAALLAKPLRAGRQMEVSDYANALQDSLSDETREHLAAQGTTHALAQFLDAKTKGNRGNELHYRTKVIDSISELNPGSLMAIEVRSVIGGTLERDIRMGVTLGRVGVPVGIADLDGIEDLSSFAKLPLRGWQDLVADQAKFYEVAKRMGMRGLDETKKPHENPDVNAWISLQRSLELVYGK